MRMHTMIRAFAIAVAPLLMAYSTGSSGGTSTLTRETFTGSASVSASSNVYAAVTTLSGDLTITLPAATTAGQLVVVGDETGTAGSAGIVKILRAGSDTIAGPQSDGTVTALVLTRDYGEVSLVADGTSKWLIVGGRGYGVDVRAISGILLDFDAGRYGGVAGTYEDMSGNNWDFTQATEGARPTFDTDIYNRSFFYFDGSDDSVATAAAVDDSSGERTVAVYSTFDWSAGGTTYALVTFDLAGVSATAGGQVVFIAATDASKFSHYGSGYDPGQAPKATIADPLSTAVLETLIISRLGTVSDVWIDGAERWSYSVQDTGTVDSMSDDIVRIGDPWKGRLFRLVVWGASLSDDDLAWVDWTLAEQFRR